MVEFELWKFLQKTRCQGDTNKLRHFGMSQSKEGKSKPRRKATYPYMFFLEEASIPFWESVTTPALIIPDLLDVPTCSPHVNSFTSHNHCFTTTKIMEVKTKIEGKLIITGVVHCHKSIYPLGLGVSMSSKEKNQPRLSCL